MKRILMIATMAAAVAMFAVTKAEAAVTVTMQLCQSGVCSGALADGNPAGNVFGSFTAAFGDYTISTLSGSGTEGAGQSTGNTTTLVVQRTGNTSANPLEIYLIAVGYTLPTGASYLLDSSTGGSTNGLGSWAFQAWYSSTNSGAINPPTGQTNGPVNCVIVIGNPNSCSNNAVGTTVVGATPFSLIGRITLTIPLNEVTTAGSSQFQYNPTGTILITAVPEPGTMVLLGTGLVALAAGLRRRMAK